MTVFDYIKAANFFPKYAPGVKDYKHKLSGKDSRGKEKYFTLADMRMIFRGVKRMSRDLTGDIVNSLWHDYSHSEFGKNVDKPTKNK